ncbi:hypothetical protein [Halorarum salinum]|uniref:DUF7979 domain-containing protein n=1 Tax=Halorarum salinum TaxID=2743089 RepID=A0A7D5LAB0_9EURY|nr:hypothetical protein [Halobaculum salinum]QLG61671.1 hypothetical protein HUG12_07995 [Halobaculum salinum]
MVLRHVLALLAVLVALSLVGSPATMADWGEQASFSVEPVERSEVDGETPVLRYETLSSDARSAVRRAVESPDGHHVVYGSGDRPEEFFYSDYAVPGQGVYAVVYEGRHYRLTTYAAGGFPFVYWLLELPFVAYGLVLAWVGYPAYRGERSARFAALAVATGVAFHLLGPEFDFPLLDPMQFVGLGAVATVLLAGWLIGVPAGDGREVDAR